MKLIILCEYCIAEVANGGNATLPGRPVAMATVTSRRASYHRGRCQGDADTHAWNMAVERSTTRVHI